MHSLGFLVSTTIIIGIVAYYIFFNFIKYFSRIIIANQAINYNSKYTLKFHCIHITMAACYNILSFIFSLQAIKFYTTYFLCIGYFTLSHMLSSLDSKFKYVPNILLIALFIIANVLYVVRHNLYETLPFVILGFSYCFYFIIHSFSKKEVIGIGDIWFFSSSGIFLESFFASQYAYIFESLLISSLFGCFFYLMYKVEKIPFIPCMLASLIIVSFYHAA